MAFLYNKLTRKVLLSLIILWGIGSFWALSQNSLSSISVSVVGLLCLIFTFYEIAPIFLLIFLSFVTSFALYGFLFQFNLQPWLIMLAILIIFSYFFVYTEQKIGILGNKRLIYLLLFSIITLEVFFTLNYFLISPLSKSLIISIISYLFIGFCYTVLAKHDDNKIQTYLLIAGVMIGLIFSTSIWGNGI